MLHLSFSGLESKPLVRVSPRTSHPCSIRCSLQWRHDDPAPVSAGFKATQQGDNRHFCTRICSSDLASALPARANCGDCTPACTGVHTKASSECDTLCTNYTPVLCWEMCHSVYTRVFAGVLRLHITTTALNKHQFFPHVDQHPPQEVFVPFQDPESVPQVKDFLQIV